MNDIGGILCGENRRKGLFCHFWLCTCIGSKEYAVLVAGIGVTAKEGRTPAGRGCLIVLIHGQVRFSGGVVVFFCFVSRRRHRCRQRKVTVRQLLCMSVGSQYMIKVVQYFIF